MILSQSRHLISSTAEPLGVYTKLSAFSDWLDATVCMLSQSTTPAFCASKGTRPGIDAFRAKGRNVDISRSGLVVSTQSGRGLETIGDGRNAKAYTLPNGVISFDDVSIEDDFIFALDIEDGKVCTYRIQKDNEIVLQSCYNGKRWNVGTFGGISCRQGVCVIAQGEHGMAIIHYDTTTGIIRGSPRFVNHLFDNVIAFYDVNVINASLAAMSTKFRPDMQVMDAPYGLVLVDLITFEHRNDKFRIRDNARQSSYEVEPSNFDLVSAMYTIKDKTSSTYLYTANGDMTVQNVDNDESTRIEESYLYGQFRAVTVAIDRGIAAFGGLVPEDNRNYIMMFDLKHDPMVPTAIGLFQIPDHIISVAIRDNLVAVVGMQDGVYSLNITTLVKLRTPAGDNGTSAGITSTTLPGSVTFIPSPYSQQQQQHQFSGMGRVDSNADAKPSCTPLGSSFALCLTIWLCL